MTTFFQFVVIGLGYGAAYSLLAQGVVAVHRASGIVNFAQGGIAVMGGFLFYELTVNAGWSWGIAFAAAVIVFGLGGAAVYWLAIRPLREASQLTQVMATLAILVTLQAIAILVWGVNTYVVEQYLPLDSFMIGDVSVQYSNVIVFVIALASTLILWGVNKFTLPGLAIRGTAENRRAVAALGWSPDILAMVSWVAGCSLGAAAGILVAPIFQLQVNYMAILLVVTLAAALVGNFNSYVLAWVGALGIGVGQALCENYLNADIQGASQAFPFVAIVVLLIVRGRGLIARGRVGERMADIGNGVVRPLVVIPLVVLMAVLIGWVFGYGFVVALQGSILFGIILLSIVLLTGYTGQLSLAQLALAGIGALGAGRLVQEGLSFPLAFVGGVVIATLAGLVFALPALRTRGMTLALVTFGLGSAVSVSIFQNTDLIGGPTGTPIEESQSIFGWNINPTFHPERYAVVVMLAFAICAVVVANVRRGRVGRRLIAVRSNERAAAALGINVYGIKLYAFGLSAAIAAIGGILMAFRYQQISYDDFSPFNSLLAVAYAVLGGVGYVAGTLYGAQFSNPGIGTWLLDLLGSGASEYLALFGGVTLILILLYAPNGVIPVMVRQNKELWYKFRPKKVVKEVLPEATPVKVEPATLEIRDLVVRFGGVTAVDGVNMTLQPGKISGLIGPNGAGKTTAIDATTGLVRAASGAILLNGDDITKSPMYKRARSGVSRSFQSLELFEGVSIRENLLAASERRDGLAFATDLVWPGRQVLTPAAVAAIREFGLEEDLDRKPSELPYGRRRLVAIARAVASQPSVLLLDEPGAGLDDSEVTEIATLVRRLATSWGISVLLVEHDMNFVMAVCDDITVIEFGKQIAHGTPEEIRKNPAVIAAYLGSPEQPGEPSVTEDVAS